MINVTADFETYFSTKDKYTLKHPDMTLTRYVRDPRFRTFGLGLKIEDQKTKYYRNIENAVTVLRNLGDINLIGQNLKFDALILHDHYGYTPARYSDTMAMSRGLWPHFRNDLASIGKRIFPNDPSMWKLKDVLDKVDGITPDELYDDHEDSKILAELLEKYCIQDVDVTWAIYKAMNEWLPDAEKDIIHIVTRNFVEPPFCADHDLLRKEIVEAEQQRKALFEQAFALFRDHGVEMDIKGLRSRVTFPDAVKQLGVTVPMKLSPTTGKPTPAFAKNDVEFIELMDKHPEFKPIWDAKLNAGSNQRANRAQRIIDASPKERGYALGVPLTYAGAATGRFSGGEKINLQNLPKGNLRLALTAPKNKLVYVRDASNIEARLNAAFAGQADLIEKFRNGEDVYSDFATKLYGYPVRKPMMERQVGKVAVLGLGYGMGWLTYQKQMEAGPMGNAPIPCSEAFAKRTVQLYRTTNYAIKQSWDEANRMLRAMKKKGTEIKWGCVTVVYEAIILPNGMYLHYPGLTSVMEETQYGPREQFFYQSWDFKSRQMKYVKIYGGKLIENIIQALATVFVKECMIACEQQIPDFINALQVHDEIIGVAPDHGAYWTGETDEYGNRIFANTDGADEIMQQMHKIMTTPPKWLPTLPLDSEGGFDMRYSK